MDFQAREQTRMRLRSFSARLTHSFPRYDPGSQEAYLGNFDLQAQQIVDIRDQLSPDTKLSCDEMGVVLPNDNDQDAAPIPSIYWNAAAAFFAYTVGHMSVMGYDILGESQLAGSPPIPQWDIPEAQFPSVTLVRQVNY